MRRPLLWATILPVLLATACSGNGHDASAGRRTTPTPVPSATPPHTVASTPTPAAPRHLVVHTERWRLPYAVAREAVAPVGSGRYVVAGGLLGGDSSTDRTLLVDPARGRVTAATSLPVPVHDTAGLALRGRALVVGGGNASEQATVQARGSRGWTVTGSLPQPRSDLTAAAVGDEALVIGGYDGSSTAMPDILASRDGRHWRRTGTLPLPVRYAASAVVGRTVWIFGGERAGVEQRAVQEVGANGQARVVSHLPAPLGHAVAVPFGGRILLAGGRLGPDSVTDRMWWFDTATHRFTPAGRLPRPLADSAVIAQGNTAWLVGGESPSVTDRVVRLTLR